MLQGKELSSELTLDKITNILKIPNDPCARCMYYMNCVLNLLDMGDEEKEANGNVNDEIKSYAYWKNYTSLNLKEKKILFNLCVIFNPNKLIEHDLFVPVDDLTAGDNVNRFVEIRPESQREIFIFKSSVRTKRKMNFSRNWLKSFYIDPIVQLDNYIKALESIESGNPDEDTPVGVGHGQSRFCSIL